MIILLHWEDVNHRRSWYTSLRVWANKSKSVCIDLGAPIKRKRLLIVELETPIFNWNTAAFGHPCGDPLSAKDLRENNACLLHSWRISEGPVIPLHSVSPLSTVSTLPVTFHLLSLGCRQERVKPAPPLWSGPGSRMPCELPAGGGSRNPTAGNLAILCAVNFPLILTVLAASQQPIFAGEHLRPHRTRVPLLMSLHSFLTLCPGRWLRNPETLFP